MAIKWENYPWFSAIGALTILSLIMYCTKIANFWSNLFPIYFTEALLYITLGFLFYKGHAKQSWLVCLMALVWFLNQAVVWGAGIVNVDAFLWLLFIGQILLTWMFFSGQKVRIFNPTDPTSKIWGYAAILVIVFYAIGKFIMDMAYWQLQGFSMTIALPKMALWGAGIILTCIGYLMPKHEYSGYLKVGGVALSAIAALTIGTSGLTLLG